MTKNYLLDPKKLNKQKRGIIILYAATGLVALTLIYISIKISNTPQPPWLVILAIPLLLIFLAVRSIRQRSELWDQYMLTLNKDFLIQHEPNGADHKLALKNVISMKETKEGIFLGTNQGPRTFGIPVLLKDEDYEELRSMLTKLLTEKAALEDKDDEEE